MTDSGRAMRGREYWLQVKGQYHPDEETGLVIVETKDQEMIDAAFRLLPGYLKRKYLSRALVLMDGETAARTEGDKGQDGVTIVAARREQIEGLLAYYRLVQFFPETVVVSVEEPFGNAHIIGKEGITLEDYVKNALYV